MQDVSTRRSLSPAEYKVRSNREVIGFIKEDFDGVHIGESKRTLKVRLTEHKCAVVRSDVNNGIAVHVAKNEHSIDWGNARVVRSVREYWERRATEAIKIRSCKNSMNLDNCLHLPATWNPILDQT